MSSIFVTAAFVIAGIIHLLPVSGVISSTQLERLYGITLDPGNADLLLLLRHRAALFGVVGLMFLLGAWRPEMRQVAGILGLLSMGSYVILGWGSQNPALTRVWWIDVVLIVVIGVALAIEHMK